MKAFLLISLILLTGCATASKMNRVSVGMTKQEVIRAVGNPNSTSAHGGTEYMAYKFWASDSDYFSNNETNYYVRLINGKVDSYGRQGDFDSTKDPSQTINLNMNR